MVKLIWCTAAIFLGSAALHADVFSFSYGGSGVSVTGTLTATITPLGVYTVTDIGGTRNGVAFDDSPTGGGLFTYGGPLGSSGSIAFSIGPLGLPDTVTFTNGSYAEVGLAGISSGKNFSITRVPEPAVLSALFAMGLGFWALSRKLPSRKTSARISS